MARFPEKHPLSELDKYFYLESGIDPHPIIYIYKFTDDLGVLIESRINDKINGPHCRLYTLKFMSDIDFKIVKSVKDIFRSNDMDLWDTVVRELKGMYKLNG